MIISGQGKPKEREHDGFLFQQLVLWFDTMALGCAWLGESKDAEKSRTKSDIITIAFGNTIEPAHRTREQIKRKPMEAITNVPEDAFMQAAHLAPSGMNTQPWYSERRQDAVLVYQQKLKPPSRCFTGIRISTWASPCATTSWPARRPGEHSTLPARHRCPAGPVFCLSASSHDVDIVAQLQMHKSWRAGSLLHMEGEEGETNASRSSIRQAGSGSHQAGGCTETAAFYSYVAPKCALNVEQSS